MLELHTVFLIIRAFIQWANAAIAVLQQAWPTCCTQAVAHRSEFYLNSNTHEGKSTGFDAVTVCFCRAEREMALGFQY
jgi:hypothetical protein